MIWLVANWRLVLLAGVALAAAVQTYRLQALRTEHVALQGQHRMFVEQVAAAGRAARADAEAKDAHHRQVKEELSREIAEQQKARAAERAARSARFGTLYDRYLGMLNAPGGGAGVGAVPEAAGRAAVAVHESSGRHVCFDRERFVAGLRRDLGALYSEVESLARRGEDGLDDQLHWGRWARLSGVCPKP